VKSALLWLALKEIPEYGAPFPRRGRNYERDQERSGPVAAVVLYALFECVANDVDEERRRSLW
jgi:hypothetical protein